MPAASSKPAKIGSNQFVEGFAQLAVAIGKGVGKGLWLLARRPRALACFALASTATFLMSTGLVLALLLMVLGAHVAGCVWLPAAFRHPARGKAKKASYARGWE